MKPGSAACSSGASAEAARRSRPDRSSTCASWSQPKRPVHRPCGSRATAFCGKAGTLGNRFRFLSRLLGPIMKKLALGVALAALTSLQAMAADLPVKARPLAVDPTYNWSGFYIGAATGGVWATEHRFMPDLPLVGV